MGRRPMPPCAPIVVANEAARPRASPRMAPATWSRPRPPYSSATVAPMKPSSAPFRTSSRASFQSFFSNSGVRGRTSLSMNCRAVSAIMRCSSVKSSGVKTSSGVRSSIRKLPPTTIFFSSATADISLLLSTAYCLQSFKNSGGAHAAANAHRDHAVASAAAFELAQDGGGQLRARAAEGVAQGDGAAVDVDAFGVEAQRLDDGERLCGEGFVQFDDINVFELEAGDLQDLRDGVDGADAHLLGRAAGRGVGDEARQRLQVQLPRALVRHDDGRGRAVRHLRRVARRNRTLRVEGGPQLRQAIFGSVAAHALVSVEGDFARRLLPLLVQFFRRD